VGASFPGFSLEKIVDLEPDLAIAFGYYMPDYVSQLDDLGILTIILAPTDLNGILANIEMIGRITGTTTQASALIASMRAVIEDITNKTKHIARPRVLWEFDASDPTKPWVAGPGSFNDILITFAGGENVAVDGAGPAFQMSAEAIVAADPEIILLGDFQYGVNLVDVLERAGWQVISAVRNGRVYPIIDSNLTDRPGPRIVEGLEMLAEIIHPELFE